MNDLKGAFRAPFFVSSSGFSLVELMIVVAIIGLLSAVAIPNFQKFQSRSRTTEAKLQLAAIYTAEASFFGTYDIYHNCLNYMGYDPREYQSTRFYSIGFMAGASINALAYSGAIARDLDPVACPSNLAPTPDSTYFLAGSGIGNTIAITAHIPPTSLGDQTIPQMVYVAGAGGVISKSFSATSNASAFTVNEKKQFQMIRPGY